MRFTPGLIFLTLTLLGCGGSGTRVAPDGGTADAAADSGGSDAVVPRRPDRCAPGHTGAPVFRDVTADWDLDVLGGRVAVADLDGDGYVDLIVHKIGNHDRADFTADAKTWPYHILMNRDDGTGHRQFVDRTVDSNYGALRTPVAGTGRSAQFAIFADLDDDGDLDALSGTYSDRNAPDTDPGDRSEILLNDGAGNFTLEAPQAAVRGFDDDRAVSTAAGTFLDYDHDGHLDLFMGYWYFSYGMSLYGNPDRLLRGDSTGAFSDVSLPMGLDTTGAPGTRGASRPSYGVTACDVDGDGDSDLLVSAYGRQWNQLWLNTDAGFVDVGEASGFDADPQMDYSDNEFYRCYCQTTGVCTAPAPRISCGTAGWNAGIDDQAWRLGGNSFSTSCADVTGDGLPDLYTAEIHHWHIGESSDSSQLLVNQGLNADGVPSYARPGNDATGLSVPHVGVSWNEGGIASDLADLDGDGHMDVLLGNSDYPDNRLLYYRQLPDGTFTQEAVADGLDHACAPSVVVGDLDRDGDLDVVVSSSTARDCSAAWPDGPEIHVYENTTGNQNNWTRIHLVGAGAAAGGANGSAIGARVVITAGSHTITREVQAGRGTFGMQDELDLVVGLGDACVIDSIEVHWPDASGSVQSFTDVPANYGFSLHQGGALEYSL